MKAVLHALFQGRRYATFALALVLLCGVLTIGANVSTEVNESQDKS
jgi:hypothetical protein